VYLLLREFCIELGVEFANGINPFLKQPAANYALSSYDVHSDGAAHSTIAECLFALIRQLPCAATPHFVNPLQVARHCSHRPNENAYRQGGSIGIDRSRVRLNGPPTDREILDLHDRLGRSPSEAAILHRIATLPARTKFEEPEMALPSPSHRKSAKTFTSTFTSSVC
jgi:hypothetical protein